MVAAVEMIAVEANKRATDLRDAGKIEESRQVLLGNQSYLSDNAAKFNSPDLKKYADDNYRQSQSLSNDEWNITRKGMRFGQRGRAYQQ
jgi:hypothetical protein